MRNFLVAAFLGAGILSANAADLAYKAAPMAAAPMSYPTWTGLYVGVNGGGAWDHGCWDLTSFRTSTGDCPSGTGEVVGGQVGYRYDWNHFVIGIEGQGDWANITGTNTNLALGGLTTNRKTDAVGLFTGQIGFSFNSALFYVKGGAGATNTQTTLGTGNNAITLNTVRFGPDIGVGLDYMFARDWSVGAAYDHLFLGHQDTLSAGNTALTVKGDIDMVTARINYQFIPH